MIPVYSANWKRMTAVQRGSDVDVTHAEGVHQVFANQVALDPDPAMHLPVAAERPGVLGQRRDVIGARIGERLVGVVARSEREPIQTGGDVQGLATPARLAEHPDNAGDVTAAHDEIGQILTGDRLPQSLIGELKQLALDRRRDALATAPRHPDACAGR